jgi:non-specific serine/threonine protein kinase/serine/threonine-protein kinase
MSADAPSNSGLPLGVQEQMNAQCDRFEAAWKAGLRPQLEEFQSLEGELPRRALLRELLLIELTYRYRLHERPVSAEYVARFPMDVDLIHVVFREFQGIASPRADKTRDDVANAEIGSYLQTPACAPAATVDVPIAEGPGATIGPYKLLERIGEGGFGLVFMAEQQQPLRRKVALKILKPGMDTRQVVARFEAERQALAIMDHPNIAKVHDGGATPSGRPYFVMELVKGVPITEFCDQNQLTPRQRLELFMPVCQAAQHAHHKGIVHRDLKPSNVLVTRHDTTPIVKVIDFGVAKALGQELTDKTLFTGLAQMMGTPLYMSPEQAGMSDLDIDTRSDIYSLGVLLYELLTGTTPFDKRRFKQAAYDEIRRIIREEEPPTPSTRLLDSKESLASISALRQMEPAKLTRLVRGDLDWIVMKALEKDRSRRYETASAFAADIAHYLNDEPVAAGPPLLGYRLKKFVHRNKGPVMAASSLLLLLIAGTVGTAVGLVRAQAREAETAAVLEFVESKVFAAARPKDEEGGLGHEVTLRRAVDAAVPFVEKGFPGQPLIEARLRMTLGISFFYLGESAKAAEQFDRARVIRSRELGPDHADTLKPMQNLASCYFALGRHDEALRLREKTFALKKATLGAAHPETLGSMNNLALSYREVGRLGEAAKLHEETLALQKATLSRDHPDVLKSMMGLAGSYYALGRHVEALKLREETLALYQATLGPEHPLTLKSMSNLATSYEALGRHAEALKLREETLPLQKAILGPDHPDTLASMNTLALSYLAFGRYAEALKLFEATLVLRKDTLGPDHPDTLMSMNNLANTYSVFGRHAEALQLHEETLALRKVKLDPDHPDTLASMGNLANSYNALGRRAEALKLREETLTLRKVKLGPDHPDTLASMNNLANSYYALGRFAEALQLREETLALRKVKLGPDHPDTLKIMWLVAENLAKLNYDAEALTIIDECVRLATGKVVDPGLIPAVLGVRLRLFAKNNDAAGCRATSEMWEKQKRSDAGSLYNAACWRAVTAGVIQATDREPMLRSKDAAAESDLAMDWLKQAVAAGFNDVAHMKQDADLDALRSRDDFKQFVAELEGETKE